MRDFDLFRDFVGVGALDLGSGVRCGALIGGVVDGSGGGVV